MFLYEARAWWRVWLFQLDMGMLCGSPNSSSICSAFHWSPGNPGKNPPQARGTWSTRMMQKFSMELLCSLTWFKMEYLTHSTRFCGVLGLICPWTIKTFLEPENEQESRKVRIFSVNCSSVLICCSLIIWMSWDLSDNFLMIDFFALLVSSWENVVTCIRQLSGE